MEASLPSAQTARPADSAGGLVAEAAHTKDEWIGHITGEVVTKAAELHVRDKSSQSEQDAQLIPGIPSYVQIPYFVAFVLGLASLETVRGWWRRLVTPQPRAEGENKLLYSLRRLPVNLIFLLVFLPIAGVPAFLILMAKQAWHTITAPIRWIRWLFGRRTA